MFCHKRTPILDTPHGDCLLVYIYIYVCVCVHARNMYICLYRRRPYTFINLITFSIIKLENLLAKKLRDHYINITLSLYCITGCVVDFTWLA